MRGGRGQDVVATEKKKPPLGILEIANSVDVPDPSAYVCSTSCSNCVGGVDSRCRDWNRYASINRSSLHCNGGAVEFVDL